MDIDVVIAQRRKEASDIDSFRLVAADGKALPPFEAGAHIDVHLPSGGVRQYSLCNPSGDTGSYLIAVLHDRGGRGGSSEMHTLVEGEQLRISSPRNLFALERAPGGRALLLAGGIGITPLIAMAESLGTEGRPFTLHYCGRTASRLAFADRLLAAPYAASVQIHLDDAGDGARLDLEAELKRFGPSDHLYVCGPGGFIEWVLKTAAAAGIDPSRQHREFFAAPTVAHAPDGFFEIEIEGTGQVVGVKAGESVVEALAGAGIKVEMSCEQGICGTCLTKVISGLPDHRDVFLTDEEHEANDCFTPCCSRSKTPRLVIALRSAA